jgi:glycosyltransferase involved in cell wall biosynthesis
MQFSIITATYNCESSIANCINSVFSQTYSKIEHILIDGNSTDNTLKTISLVPNRISKIISEPDRGIYDAINKGIAISTGDIIGLLHSDDEFASCRIIGEVAKKFQETDADIIYGDLEYVKKKDRNSIVRYWRGKPFNRSLINKGWMPAHPTLFVRSEVLKKYGLYNTKFQISSDYEFMIRLMKSDDLKLEYLPIVMIKMSLGGVSNRNIRTIILKSLEDYSIMKMYKLPMPLIILLRKNLSKLNQFFFHN